MHNKWPFKLITKNVIIINEIVLGFWESDNNRQLLIFPKNVNECVE